VIGYGDRQGQELREMLLIVEMVQVDLHFEVAVGRKRVGTGTVVDWAAGERNQ